MQPLPATLHINKGAPAHAEAPSKDNLVFLSI